MLNDGMPSVVVLNVVMLSAAMLNDVMLNAVMLNVVVSLLKYLLKGKRGRRKHGRMITTS